jgi:cytochrome c556
MKRFSVVLMLVAVVSAGSLLVRQPQVRADAPCGEKGQPSCPLQGWMEKNMQGPFDKKDLKKLAESLEKAASFVPDPKWNDGEKGWAKLAKDGAAAAKAGDFAGTQQACKACHKAWRNEYKKQFRLRPISG